MFTKSNEKPQVRIRLNGSQNTVTAVNPVRDPMHACIGIPLSGIISNGVNKILSANGRWGIDEDENFSAVHIETQTIQSQKGYTVPDEDTGSLYCITVKSGAIVALPGSCGGEKVEFSEIAPLPFLQEPKDQNASTVASSTTPE